MSEGRRVVAVTKKKGLAPVSEEEELALYLSKFGANRERLLDESVRGNNPRLVFFLLENGARVTNIALLEAVRGNCLAILRLLLKAKSDGCSLADPLWVAAEKGLLDMVCLFLGNGADPNEPCWRGVSPLHAAINKGHTKVVRVLCAAGADVHLHDPDTGLLPLVCARDNLKIATTLLRYGADPWAALTQMREQNIEEGAAVERIAGWPRVSSLRAMCLRFVEKHRMTGSVPDALLLMPKPDLEVERERQRRLREEEKRGQKRKRGAESEKKKKR